MLDRIWTVRTKKFIIQGIMICVLIPIAPRKRRIHTIKKIQQPTEGAKNILMEEVTVTWNVGYIENRVKTLKIYTR